MENFKLDKTDFAIIKTLLKNAKTPYKDISRELNVSLGTIHVRIKKLETMGIIDSYSIKLNYNRLGCKILVFVGIIIESSKYRNILKSLQKIDELIELHNTTGKFHLMGKLYFKDTQHLTDILINKINAIDGVQKTETIISLSQINKHPGTQLLDCKRRL